MNFTHLFSSVNTHEEGRSFYFENGIFTRVFSFVRLHAVDCILLFTAVIVTGFNLYRLGSSPVQVAGVSIEQKETRSAYNPSMSVEVAGAVYEPGVFAFEQGARLSDAIKRAGGLSTTADTDFFGRNFNMARYISDQEKIYVPSKKEIASGIFVEEKYTLEYLHPASATDLQTTQAIVPETELIHINSASLAELDALAGIGPVTAQKIIDGRPFARVEELVTRNILRNSVLEQVRQKIVL